VHLIYRAQPYEGIAKDFEFSRRSMEEHWQAGYSNARETLANPEVLQLPDRAGRSAHVRCRPGAGLTWSCLFICFLVSVQERCRHEGK